MNFNNFLLTDTSGKKSTTLTVFVLGALVIHIKFLFSTMVLFGHAFPSFGGSDYAIAMGAIGGIYVLRRNTDPNNKKNSNNSDTQD
jgi:hypothetical protein